LNHLPVKALFDTGSAVTLVSSKYKDKLQLGERLPEIVKLSSANGSPLYSGGTYQVKVRMGNHAFFHPVTFIKNLRANCIIGMDLMNKANISLNCKDNKIIFKTSSMQMNYPLSMRKSVVLEANTETLVQTTCPVPFTSCLVDSVALAYPLQDVTLMDGLCSTTDTEGVSVAPVLLANHGHLPVKLEAGTVVGLVDHHTPSSFPLDAVLAIRPLDPTRHTSPAHVDKIDLTAIPSSYRPNYKNLLSSFADVFSKNDLDVGHCRSLPHKVRLKDPNRITAINQYRLPHHLKEVAIDYVKKLLQAGVVRKSSSIFNSPLMLVKKPHADPTKPLAEQYRLVHNYIDLNKNISPCSYPLRNLYELLDEVASGKVFSVLDLSQGFFQQHLDDPQESTSFSIPGVGQYTYTRSPQGLNSSPAYFQRMLDYVLQGIDRVYVYIDDVVVSVNSHEESLSKLKEVFQRLRKHNLKIKPGKCNIGAGSITYLGYKISSTHGISPGEAKTEAVKNWPEPTSVKDIRAFIGLTSFFRRAIKDFSIKSGPLNKLVRKDSGYKSGKLPDVARQSFLDLKQALISKPCLRAVDFNRRFYVTCDASATHYGSCLSQIGDDQIERPCGYSSKLLNEKEANQTPGIRERAALLYALRHWHPYLIGKEFTIRTDHKPNLSISTGKTKVYDSLTDEILSYQPFVLEFLNGQKMFVDALSRPPNAVSLARVSDPLFSFSISGLPSQLDVSVQELKVAQLSDHNLGKIITQLRTRSNAKATQAYRLDKHGLLQNLQGQSVVPDQLKARLLYAAHDASGHTHSELMLSHLRGKYCWKGMTRDASNYAGSCAVCSRANVARPRHLSPLDKMNPEAVWFNDRLHLDIVDMPKSTSGELAVVTMVDAATGFTILHPVSNKTSDSIVSALTTRLFPYFGIPSVLVTDKGKENINQEVQKLLATFQIHHIVSSTAHPQSNGMVERRQQMISQFFRKMVESHDDQLNWPSMIPTLQLVINSSKSSTRGFSPFFLTYFRNPNFPFSELVNQRPQYGPSSVHTRLNIASKIVKQARDWHDSAMAKAKVQFDKQVKLKSFHSGNIVYVYTSQHPNIHKKFAKRYKGPYLCLNADNNILDLRPLNGGRTIRAHMNNCKLGTLREQLFDFRPSTVTEHVIPVSSPRARSYHLLAPLAADDDGAPQVNPGADANQPDQPEPDPPGAGVAPAGQADQANQAGRGSPPPAAAAADDQPAPPRPPPPFGGARPKTRAGAAPLDMSVDQFHPSHYRDQQASDSEESDDPHEASSDEDRTTPPPLRRKPPIHAAKLGPRKSKKRKHDVPAEAFADDKGKPNTRARVKADDIPLAPELPPPTRAKRKDPQHEHEGYDPLPGEQALKTLAKSVKDLVKKS
jgi:hypothetical protein